MTETLDERKGRQAVLVIDDHDLVRETVGRLLEPLGVRILEAASGEEGLALLDASPEVRVVVLDLQMPGLDGEQVLSSIRAGDRPVPVVILSGALDEERSERLLAAGAASCIEKTQAAGSLRTVVHRLLAAATPSTAARRR